MKDLLTIGRAAKLCGVSRNTILRLEERGLLTPAYQSKESGYRYYDNYNITPILQTKRLFSMGIGYDGIREYYSSAGTSAEFLKTLTEKASILQRWIEEISLRFDKKNNLSSSIISLPKTVCYAREFSGSDPEDMYNNMYGLFYEAVNKGLCPGSSEPLFIIHKRSDFLRGEYSLSEHRYVCCIPLEADCPCEDTLTLPSCKALSVLYYGSYENVGDAYIELGRKAKELGLTPADSPRGLGIVPPYTGRNIDPENYVTRLALPLKDDDEGKTG